MFYFIKNAIKEYFPSNNEKKLVKKTAPVVDSLEKNLMYFKDSFDDSADLTIRKLKVGKYSGAIITIEGMVDKENLAVSVLNPVLKSKLPENLKLSEQYEYIKDEVLSSGEQIESFEYEDASYLLMSGFALFLLDGIPRILAIGLQGFSFRNISEPVTEVMQKGSREGFVEAIKVNMTLIRRRIKNPKLKFENMSVGSVSKTDICLVYLSDVVSSKILNDLKKRIENINLEYLLTAEYLIPYLEEKKSFSFFNTVSVTERPDTVCGKISEGRIAILVDGTPSAVIVPYLFIEYFQTLDDYSQRPFFSTMERSLKYVSFFISILLPGLYVALGTFNPEVFPIEIMKKIVTSIGNTPFPLLLETIIILFIYEVMREAGLRLPRALGHAVSIVGALVIGETALTSGLVGAPTLMIVALTAISSYVIPNLYESTAILRLLFTIVGGTMGIIGINILFLLIIVNICSKNNYNIPFTAPIVPFGFYGMRDVILRADWKTLSKKTTKVQDLPKIRK